MSDQLELKVQIEFGNAKHTAQGSPENVLQEIIAFVTRVAPMYDVASKIMFTPDYVAMVEDLSKLVKITLEGQPLLTRSDLPADKAIGLVLLAAHIANRLGKRASEEISAEEIAGTIGKAVKTIRNTVAELQRAGLVERATRGTYKITAAGLRQVHEDAKKLSASTSHGGVG